MHTSFDPMSTKQLISKIPVFDWPQLHGKTLTIYVDVAGERDTDIQHTTVCGKDAEGRVYVLVSTRERINVHPKQW